MTILFPPVLESQSLAFPYKKKTTGEGDPMFYIQFPLPTMVSYNDIKHVQVSLKYANTGAPAVNSACSQDNQVLYISAKASYQYCSYDFNTNIYTIKIPYRAFAGGAPSYDTTYLVQVRFGSNDLWDNVSGLEEGKSVAFANWRRNSMLQVPSYFGEWSNIQRAYCYQEGTHEIDYNLNDFMPEIVWTYSAVGDDPIAQAVIYYSYNGFEGTINKSQIFNGGYNNDNVFTISQKLNVAPVTPIEIKVEAVTKNNTVYTDSIGIPSIVDNKAMLDYYTKTTITDTKLAEAETEDGVLAKTIALGEDVISDGTYNVYRFNTLSFECIKIIDSQKFLQGETFSFKDFTVEMGEDYQYVIMLYTLGQSIVDPNVKTVIGKMAHNIKPIGPKNVAYGRLMKMEYSFLTSKKHQLRLMGNVTLSSFKRNTQDNFQTTIGGQYPFYSRASRMNYRSFQLSAAVSVNFDPTATFIRLDTFGNIQLEEVISEKKYLALISASPGLEKYFQKEVSTDDEVVYRFIYPGGPLTRKEVVELVNRCTSTLIMNGLWWDSDDMDGYSQLLVQDRDLITTEEISLSRKRIQRNREDNGDEVVSTDSPNKFFDIRNDGTADNPVFGYDESGKQVKTYYSEFKHRFTDLNYGTIPTDTLIFVERKFREKVMDWLADGKPKIFRSETEGNMIVVLSAISFTPLTQNRMVYTLSATVTEIADFTTENLIQYNLLPQLIFSSYVGGHEYDFIPGNYDPAYSNVLRYVYNESFDIPNMRVNDSNGEISIYTYDAVMGIPPFKFSSPNLPKGFTFDAITFTNPDNPSLSTVAGRLHGYPTEPLDKGTISLVVEDSGGRPDPSDNKATMVINHGIFYDYLTSVKDLTLFTDDENDTIIVGTPIKPGIFAEEAFSGGLKPYTYYGYSLPSGIFIDKKTGEFYGQYLNEFTSNPDGGDYSYGYVLCMDSTGQAARAKVRLMNSKYELVFTKLSDFDYDYTEVEEPIPEKNLMDGIFGGQAPYTFEVVAGSGFPEGWSLVKDEADAALAKRPVGTIYGTPTKAISEDGQFSIKAKDSLGQEKTITIYRKQILEKFTFPYQEAYDLLRVKNDDGTYGELMDRIPYGTQVQGIFIEIGGDKGVTGGLPFEGDYPYQFDSTGLSSNFKITTTGELIGKATKVEPEHQAIIYAIDRRTKKIPMTGNPKYVNSIYKGQGITVVQVSAQTKVYRQRIELRDLMVDSPLKDENVISLDLDGEEIEGKVIPATIFSPTSFLDGLEISLDNFPDGISVKVNKNATSGVIESFEFTGTPTEITSARTGTITFNGKKESLPLTVKFPTILNYLQKTSTKTYILSGSAGSEYKVFLTDVTGGKPPFSAELISAPTWITQENLLCADISSSSSFFLSGVLPKEATAAQDFKVRIKDAAGRAIDLTIHINEIAEGLTVPVLSDFLSAILLKDISYVNKVNIFTVNGGKPPYTVEFNGEKLPGNLTFGTTGDGTTQPLYGYIDGIPNEVYSLNKDISSCFKIKDSEGHSCYITSPIYMPQIILAPQIGEVYLNGKGPLTEEVDYNLGVIKAGISVTLNNIFKNLEHPSIEIKTDPLPYQLQAEKGDSYRIVGSIITSTNDPIRFSTELTISADNDPYLTNSIKRKVNFTIEAVSGEFKFILKENNNEIPAVAIGTPIIFDLSGGLEGGVGPFDWSIEPNLPAGLSLNVNASNTRICKIQGAPTEKCERTVYRITVVDQGNSGVSAWSSLTFNGAYEPIVITGSVNVPDCKKDDTITSISLDPMVSGGSPPYSYSDPDGIFTRRGYGIDSITNSIAGMAEGPASRVTGRILVTDSNGQTANIPTTLGKIDGELTFISENSGVIATIKAGKKGTTLPQNELLNLTNGAVGGVPPYTFSENTAEGGWKGKGWECTMDATGKFTAIKRPANACPAGTFNVILKDSAGTTAYPLISYGEVTD